MIKLSIIMPVYNREKFVGQAVKSILKQDFRDFELIVIDDGSLDKSGEIIKAFKDKRINYQWQANAGECPATNKGLKKSKGRYITWVHSDDVLPEGSLSARVEILDQNPGAEIAHGDIKKIDEDGNENEILIATNNNHQEIFKHYCINEEKRTKQKYYVHHTTFMFRKEILKKVGFFDESLSYGGDLDWMMRAIKKCTMKRIPEILYYYRRHPHTITREDKRKGIKTAEVTKMIQKRYCLKILKEGDE